MTARYLVDKSALARMRHETVSERLGPLIEGGFVATCAIIELEVLYSARTHDDLVRIAGERRLALDWVPLHDEVFQRALAVQELLARHGQHRVPIPDLIIAAAAEHAGMVVLHYDKDYDLIASASGQPVEWVVPRGSVD